MRVDEDFLNEVGLGEMPEDEKAAFMAHAEEELEIRVGQNIGNYLNDSQMLEFEEITDSKKAAEWLEKNVPNFREVVMQVFTAFKNEIIAEQAKILGY